MLYLNFEYPQPEKHKQLNKMAAGC